jgi:ABC-type antimicrobial peptide transport system permease subunit
VAESSSFITKGNRTTGGLDWKGKDPGMADEFTTVGVSTDYGKTVGWELIAGRDFSSQYNDASGLIINEAAVKYMGLKQPLGTTVTWNKKYTIIGVIKNIIMTSPYDPVKPAVYFMTPEAGYLNIKLSPNTSTAEALATIEAVCKKYSPVTLFNYKFADEEYAAKFADDQRIGNFAMVFAVLAIFISCLGLFGLASFMAEQRTREIGVRKVLGASTFSLWRLQSGDFLLLVMISILIATPTAYYFMYNWLENYQYRTELSWWVFATAGLGAIIITLFTVSYQSIKTALSNPVKSLRTE